MKITKLETFVCEAGWRNWIFLKASTDQGLVGWSELTESNGSPKAILGAVEDLSRLVVGGKVEPERVYWDLYRATRQSPGGVIAKAIGGIENALWDLKGKELGVPVYELFGGPTRSAVQCYWSHCGTTRARAWRETHTRQLASYSDVEALACEVVLKGFTALKTNVIVPGNPPWVVMPGFKGPVPDQNLTNEVIDALERLMDHFLVADVDLILDLNFNFKPEGIVRIARALEPYDLLWLEADCYDPESLADVRGKITQPLCSGENLYGNRGFKPYMGSLDIASVDVIWNGFSQSKKIADLCEVNEVNIVPHNYYSHLSSFISANLCAAVPNVRMLEMDVDDVPWKDELTSVPDMHLGNMTIPKGWGWGCDVNERVLRDHLV